MRSRTKNIVGQGKDFSVNKNAYRTDNVPSVSSWGHGSNSVGARKASHAGYVDSDIMAENHAEHRARAQKDIRKKLVKEFASRRRKAPGVMHVMREKK